MLRSIAIAAVILLACSTASHARGYGRGGYGAGYYRPRPYGGYWSSYTVTAPWGATISGGTFGGYGQPVAPVYVAPVAPMYAPMYYAPAWGYRYRW